MIFNKNRLFDFTEQALDALTQENVRLRAANSKLQDKLMSFCEEAFGRMKSVEIQEKQLDAMAMKNHLMDEIVGQEPPKDEVEEKERKEAELTLNHTLGLS